MKKEMEINKVKTFENKEPLHSQQVTRFSKVASTHDRNCAEYGGNERSW